MGSRLSGDPVSSATSESLLFSASSPPVILCVDCSEQRDAQSPTRLHYNMSGGTYASVPQANVRLVCLAAFYMHANIEI
jgi:hypothetical protein